MAYQIQVSQPQHLREPGSSAKPNPAAGIGKLYDRLILGGYVIGQVDDRLAALAMRMIATWAYVDHGWGTVLSALLNAEWGVTAQIWTALSSSAQRQALRAAADLRLKDRPEDLALLKAVGTAVELVRERRNWYAHYLWARSIAYPDRLCLVKYSIPTQAAAARREAFHRSPRSVGLALLLLPSDPHPTGWSVEDLMTDEDLERVPAFQARDIEKDIVAAQEANRLVYLLGILAARDSRAAEARRMLSQELRILPPKHTRRRTRGKPPQ